MRFSLALLFAATLSVVAGCNSDSGKTTSADPTGSKHPVGHFDKLIIDDVKKGTGEKVVNGDDVWVKYTGKLTNGTVFDSNMKGDKPPLHVMVGQEGPGGVIKGWNLGLVGMQQGGTRKLSIPTDLAYGAKPPSEKIPPNSDLVFDVVLVQVLKAKDADVISADDVKVGTGKEVKEGDTVTVTYKASVFGEEVESKPAITFKLGEEQMAIRGFDAALAGMKVGGERKVKIPPGLTMTIQDDALRNNLVIYDVHLEKIQ